MGAKCDAVIFHLTGRVMNNERQIKTTRVRNMQTVIKRQEACGLKSLDG